MQEKDKMIYILFACTCIKKYWKYSKETNKSISLQREGRSVVHTSRKGGDWIQEEDKDVNCRFCSLNQHRLGYVAVTNTKCR